jgi:AraC-like DNA-binding protein
MTDPESSNFSYPTFLNRCQVAIGQLSAHPIDLTALWRALSCPPDDMTDAQRLMTVALVADLLTRLRAEKRITRVPTWAELRALFEGPAGVGARRRLAAFRLLEVQNHRRGRPGCPDLAGWALRTLTESYRDANLSLTAVADHLRVTAGHLGRVIRKRTGHSFGWHLHEIRTRQAAKLLDGRMAVKEVATRVGYPSASEFDRHFRATFGMTPSAYRTVVLTPGSDPSLQSKTDLHA